MRSETKSRPHGHASDADVKQIVLAPELIAVATQRALT